MKQARLVCRSTSVALLTILVMSFSVLALSGCGSDMSSSADIPNQSSMNFNGIAHGGQQPLNGSHIYLFAMNQTTYGGASTSLLTSSTGHSDAIGNYVLTDSAGDFNIAGDFTCTAGTYLYLYALGGDPQLGGTASNLSAGMLAVLGSCAKINSISFVWMDEVSTIASAYALAGFATDATHIGGPTSTTLQLSNLGNAVNTSSNIENLATGLPLSTTPAGNGTVPVSEINTLADVLASCINSTGSLCTALFSNTKNRSNIAPTDTATAAINIAQHPAANVSKLLSLVTESSPFQPVLGNVNDFTLSVHYTGGGLATPYGIAIDTSGNVWASNGGANKLTELSSMGAPLSGSGFTGAGIDSALGIAIGSTGNVWLANYGPIASGHGVSISRFSSSGTAISDAAGDIGGGLDGPFAIALDSIGNAWMSNSTAASGGSLSEFNSSGIEQSDVLGDGNTHLFVPEGIAFDGSGNSWIANNRHNVLSEFVLTGASPHTQVPLQFSGGGLNSPTGVALDSNGNVWVANGGSNNLSEFNSSGKAISLSRGYTGGGLNVPIGIAVDGSGNIWTANSGGSCGPGRDATKLSSAAGSVSEFNSAGTALSPSTGFTSTGASAPYGIAVDGSGNVWATNSGSNTVNEFIGAATPVVTPIVANLAVGSNQPAQRP